MMISVTLMPVKCGMNMTDEMWKDIPGFEGLYQASSDGLIRSHDKAVKYPNGARGIAIKRGKVLSPKISNRGYKTVVLIDSTGKRYTCSVHRLVAKTFIPNPCHLPYINHIDENKFNNKISNLEWCTPKYNSKEYTKKRCLLIQYDLQGNLVREWDSMTEAAESVGGCKSGIYHCCHGDIKTYKGFIWRYKENL